LGQKSQVWLIHETIAFRESKMTFRGHKLKWKPSVNNDNKHIETCCWSWLLVKVVAPKGAVCSILQCCLGLITSTLILPLCARKYHPIWENLQGKWPTISLPRTLSVDDCMVTKPTFASFSCALFSFKCHHFHLNYGL